MKKLSILFFVLIVSFTTSYSQSIIGGGLALGSNSGAYNVGAPGLFLQGEFYVNDKWSFSPDAIIYVVSNRVNESRGFWEVNANANYYVYEDWELSFYGIAGLNLSTASYKLDGFGRRTNSELGLNVGAGVNWDIQQNFTPFSEVKFTLGNYDQAVFKVGIKYQISR